jgi:hypothetical protein
VPDGRLSNKERGSTYGRIEPPTLLKQQEQFDSPLARFLSTPSALEAASKTLNAVDAFRVGRQLTASEPLSAGAYVSIALFLYSNAPSWAKPPFVYTYYEGGFEREYHLSELFSPQNNPAMLALALQYGIIRYNFPQLSNFDATKLIGPDDAAKLLNSLINATDKAKALIETTMDVASSQGLSAFLHSLELLVRTAEAGKSFDELGNEIPLPGAESSKPNPNSGSSNMIRTEPEWFRGNDPRENSRAIDQPGFKTSQEFHA